MLNEKCFFICIFFCKDLYSSVGLTQHIQQKLINTFMLDTSILIYQCQKYFEGKSFTIVGKQYDWLNKFQIYVVIGLEAFYQQIQQSFFHRF